MEDVELKIKIWNACNPPMILKEEMVPCAIFSAYTQGSIFVFVRVEYSWVEMIAFFGCIVKYGSMDNLLNIRKIS